MLPLNQLQSLLALNRRDIKAIFVFAMVHALLSLVVPIAAQGIVTIVSFGTIRQPLFVLVFTVFALLAFSAITRLLQNILIETIQQKIFASCALKIADRLPHLKLSTLDESHGTEALNKFFDIMLLQKSVSYLLPNISSFLLQATVGFILLGLYHPVLIAYDFVFLIALLLVIFLPMRQGLSSAIGESNAKYNVASWLEEMVRVAPLFHFSDNSKFGFNRADLIVVNYLKERKSHYHTLIKHMVGAYGLQVASITSLFLIGGILVLHNQMTLGQLVAAEIVVTALAYQAATMPFYLERFYDLCAAAQKVQTLLTMPTDQPEEHLDQMTYHAGELTIPPNLIVKNLILPLHAYQKEIFFEIKEKTSSAILVDEKMSQYVLADCLLGLRSAVSGEIIYNDLSIVSYSLNKFRKRVSLIRKVDYFDGTLLDNIVMRRHGIEIDTVTNMLKDFSLLDFIQSLPEKLNYEFSGATHPFSNEQFLKLQLIREILANPMLIVIDEAFDVLTINQCKSIINKLNKYTENSTFIVLTRRVEIADLYETRINI